MIPHEIMRHGETNIEERSFQKDYTEYLIKGGTIKTYQTESDLTNLKKAFILLMKSKIIKFRESIIQEPIVIDMELQDWIGAMIILK